MRLVGAVHGSVKKKCRRWRLPDVLSISRDMRNSGSNSADRRFFKMHGLGNDFVIIDAREAGGVGIDARFAKRLGSRNRGVGFDQLIELQTGSDSRLRLAFWNADGTKADACGNGTRCAARLVMDETGKTSLEIETGRGWLVAEDAGGNLTRVNMGHPHLDWRSVPLAYDVPLDPLPIDGAPAAVGMGNPHCVFVVEEADAVNPGLLGPEIERDPLFPERTNVEFVQVLDRKTIRMRVWERGGRITEACGSGACAAVVTTAERGLTEPCVTVRLDGGDLEIDWRDDGVWMTGPTTMVYEGRLSKEFLRDRL